MLLDTWHETRRKGLGASDAAIACGFSPWDQPLGLYLAKIGQAPPRKQTSAMRLGTMLEPIIAKLYEEDTGTELVVPEQFKTHPEHSFLFANGDRTTPDWKRLVELKTANAFAANEWGEPGTDQIPPYYLFQTQQQMACYDVDVCDVAALIGGSDFRIYTVRRSEQFIGKMIFQLIDFWEMVKDRRPPPPDFARGNTAELLEALYPAEDGKVVELGPADGALAENYVALGQRIRDLEDERKTVKANLLGVMGTAKVGLAPGGYKIQRATVSRKGYAVEPTTFNTLTVKGPK